MWFVGIGSGWTSYLTPDGKLVPVFNCNPPPELVQTCEPQGTRWFEGKLYLTSRHRGIFASTNFAFGGPDNHSIYLEGAASGTFWRFKAPHPGLIGPGGIRLPVQP